MFKSQLLEISQSAKTAKDDRCRIVDANSRDRERGEDRKAIWPHRSEREMIGHYASVNNHRNAEADDATVMSTKNTSAAIACHPERANSARRQTAILNVVDSHIFHAKITSGRVAQIYRCLGSEQGRPLDFRSSGREFDSRP